MSNPTTEPITLETYAGPLHMSDRGLLMPDRGDGRSARTDNQAGEHACYSRRGRAEAPEAPATPWTRDTAPRLQLIVCCYSRAWAGLDIGVCCDAAPERCGRTRQPACILGLPGHSDDRGQGPQFMGALSALGQVGTGIRAPSVFAERDQGQDFGINVRHRQPPAWPAAAAGCGGCGF